MGKKVVVDEKEVWKLAEVFCTQEEIAAAVGCSVKTIRRRYGKLIKQAREKGKVELRKRQWEGIEKGSVTLLVWFGKQFLEQSEKVENNIDEEQFKELLQIAHATMVQLAGAGRATSGHPAVSNGGETV